MDSKPIGCPVCSAQDSNGVHVTYTQVRDIRIQVLNAETIK